MFGLGRRDPHKALRKQWEAKLREARDVQRGGDVVQAAILTAEAEELRRQLDAAEAAERQ